MGMGKRLSLDHEVQGEQAARQARGSARDPRLLLREAAPAAHAGAPRRCRRRDQPQAARDPDAAAAGERRQAADPGPAGGRRRSRRPGPRGADPPRRRQHPDRRPCHPARRPAGAGGEAHPGVPAAAGQGRRRSGPARRRSRRPTPPPRPRPRSAKRSPASPRRWATSASRCSGPRTRRSRCRPAPALSMSCSPPVRSTTPRWASAAGDDIQRELDRTSADSDVELELAKLKGALPAGEAPAAIASGAPADATPAAAPAEAAARRLPGRGAVMIVRILGEGQFEVPDGALGELDGLDTTLRVGPARPASTTASRRRSPRCSAGFASSAPPCPRTTSARPSWSCRAPVRRWPR